MNDQHFCTFTQEVCEQYFLFISTVIIHNFNLRPTTKLNIAICCPWLNTCTQSDAIIDTKDMHVSWNHFEFMSVYPYRNIQSWSQNKEQNMCLSFFHPPSRVGRQKCLGVATQSKGHPYLERPAKSRKLDDKVDLKGAYFMLPIHQEDRAFLKFIFHEKTYQFRCLPFGLACAPWVFTKIIKPLTAQLGQLGMWPIVYIDAFSSWQGPGSWLGNML